MTEKPDDLDVMYYQLVLSMQASAMQHLGKVVSQVTGQVERNLEAARYSIDMLEMLKRKTAGNLSDEEGKLIEHVLYELRLNYVDESAKGDVADEAGDSPSEAAGSGEAASEAASEEPKTPDQPDGESA
jgi:hypothetical protein